MARPTDIELTREHWDEQAARYDSAKARNDGYYSALKAVFERAVPREDRGRVLDVGCGTGQILVNLRPTVGVGIDLSEQMIRQARARYADRDDLRFYVMDAEAAASLEEGGAEGFDVVISSDLLEHVPAWETVVDAMAAACRPGGLIVVSTPNPGWALPLWVLEKMKLKMPEGPHEFVSGKRIAARLRERGCEVKGETTHVMVPARLGGLGALASGWAERMPVLRRWGVVQLVVARRNEL